MSRVMSALVTGSSGFIGRNFARHLHEQGWSVTGIDVAPGAWTTSIADARMFFWRDRGQNMAWDLVIHAAAVVGGRHVIENDPLLQAPNLALDAGLFAWARRARPGRVVYFSSSAVYPVQLQTADLEHPLHEDDVVLPDGLHAPDSLYGWTKLTGEYLARLAREDGLAVSVVRPFSGYGPDQDETYPFGAFAGRAARREDPFLVWGDGEQVRDFVHVDDIVATVMEMVRAEHNGPLNIGWGQPVTMRRLAALFCEQAGYAPAIETAPYAPSGVRWRVAQTKRLWDVRLPRIPLEQGVAQALARYQDEAVTIP